VVAVAEKRELYFSVGVHGDFSILQSSVKRSSEIKLEKEHEL
jgi:hypothetical protein